MKHKTTRRLIISLIGIAALCVVVFSAVTEHMRGQSAQAIRYIGGNLMSSMSRQVTMHLGATLRGRLEQVEDLAQDSMEHTSEELIHSARDRGFDYLSLYVPDEPSSLHPMYGSRLTPEEGEEEFLSYLERGVPRMALGRDEEGQAVILLGAPGSFRDGEHTGTAFVAGMQAGYIDHNLEHELEAGMVDSFSVIRADGSFVIKGNRPAGTGSSYFQLVSEILEEGDPEEYIARLQKAMEGGEEFSAEVTLQGHAAHIFAGPISDTGWYLLLNTPYGAINNGIDSLGETWSSTAFGGCAVILFALLAVFAWYIGVTRRQLRDVEEARIAAERASHAKSQFLSNMSHDVRTPMNGIVGMTAIAMANLDDRETVERCLKRITHSSRHLLGLINDILDMGKIDSGKMTLNMGQVSLREVMQQLVSIVQQQVKLKKQSFDVYIDNITAENVCCDSVRLNQIFLNLLSNAIKFTPEGGSIRVTLNEEPSPKGEDYVRSHLQVKDNGIGMTEEFVGHIFESFARADNARVDKTQGVGVGMTITKHIVDAMGGTIEVHSKPGEGTEVDVFLDLQKATVPEEDMVLPDWAMLVVDDDETLCASAVATLKTLGVHADWAMSAEDALRMAQERQDRGEGYQVLLVDWRLPDTDGIETAEQLRQVCGENACILLTSAYDRDDMDAAARERGIDGEIAKPLFKSTLYYGLLKYMGEKGQEEPPAQQKGPDVTGRRVIVAEDNDLNWEIAEELLSEAGMELVRAENGKICVEMFEASQPEEYDGILMDLRMPEMNGYEATEAIRAMDRPDAKTIAIVAMSADAFQEDVQRCLDAGMNAHSAKPIDVDLVVRLLAAYMRPKK